MSGSGIVGEDRIFGNLCGCRECSYRGVRKITIIVSGRESVSGDVRGVD